MFARKGRGEQLANKEKMDDWIKEEMMIMDGGAVGVKTNPDVGTVQSVENLPRPGCRIGY